MCIKLLGTISSLNGWTKPNSFKSNYEVDVKYPSGFRNSINKALLPSF